MFALRAYQLSRICLHLLQPVFIIIFSVWPRVRLVRAAGRVSCLPPDRGRTQPTGSHTIEKCVLVPPDPSGAAHSLRYRSGRADELGTMGRCDATFFSTMHNLKKETHTHTHPRSRLAGIPEPTAVNTRQSEDPGHHSRARELHTYKYGHNHP